MPASHSDQNRMSIIILGVLFLHHHHHHNDIVPSPPSSSQLYCSITTIITTIILVSWPDPNSSQPPQCNSSNHNFLTLRYFQGYLLYGYGGKKLYEYSVFKPLEGYFKWPDLSDGLCQIRWASFKRWHLSDQMINHWKMCLFFREERKESMNQSNCGRDEEKKGICVICFFINHVVCGHDLLQRFTSR